MESSPLAAGRLSKRYLDLDQWGDPKGLLDPLKRTACIALPICPPGILMTSMPNRVQHGTPKLVERLPRTISGSPGDKQSKAECSRRFQGSLPAPLSRISQRHQGSENQLITSDSHER